MTEKYKIINRMVRNVEVTVEIPTGTRLCGALLDELERIMHKEVVGKLRFKFQDQPCVLEGGTFYRGTLSYRKRETLDGPTAWIQV